MNLLNNLRHVYNIEKLADNILKQYLLNQNRIITFEPQKIKARNKLNKHVLTITNKKN